MVSEAERFESMLERVEPSVGQRIELRKNRVRNAG
jgi:hypothetical protein